MPKVDYGLTGRTAIVTGGTRGLGRAISAALAAQGCKVVACARSEPEGLPDGVEFAALDVRDPEAVEAFVNDVAARHGGIDIVVNNAGGSPESDASTASPRFAEAISKLNFLAPYFPARAAHPYLLRSEGAAIVNIASVSGIRPSPGTAIYGASKAALLSLTRSLAQEWGPQAIRVNAIIVGLAETETTADTYGSENAQAKIASPASEYVSGAWLNVDGGGERPLFLDIVKGG